MMMKMTILVTSLLATSVAVAQKKGEPVAPAAAPPAPELKKTVDAFKGAWAFEAKVTTPDGKTVQGKAMIDCKAVAKGKAASCTMQFKIPGFPDSEGSVLVGWDTFSKSVHFMAMTSDEEVHDHKCAWKDDKNLVCDPLKGGWMGQPITEDLSFMFDGKTGAFKAAITLPDGKKLLFDAAGKRK